MDILTRRDVVRAGAGLAAFHTGLAASLGLEQGAKLGSKLEAWKPGHLDIHHIQTGRGNSTLLIGPDGTSILVDAGAVKTTGPSMNAARPNDSRRPGQWISRYIARQLHATGHPKLDYVVLTHFHGDHVGDIWPDSPTSTYGNYRLTGISDVAEEFDIVKLIDRGFPSYNYPSAAQDATLLNYLEFAKSAGGRGTLVEQVQVGSVSQVRLKEASHVPFAWRFVAGNGRVWTGQGEESRLQFPSQIGLAADRTASENSCSIALRISFGRFSYFTGGDLNCDTRYGSDPWQDMESAAAVAAGPVSVSTCNHHGYFDANGPRFVGALQARVWIVQGWHASHPAISALANLYSPVLYPGPRDVFCTGLHPAAALVCGRFSDQFKSSQGHVVVRVSPGGADFSVMVVEDGDETDNVKAAYGPYTC